MAHCPPMGASALHALRPRTARTKQRSPCSSRHTFQTVRWACAHGAGGVGTAVGVARGAGVTSGRVIEMLPSLLRMFWLGIDTAKSPSPDSASSPPPPAARSPLTAPAAQPERPAMPRIVQPWRPRRWGSAVALNPMTSPMCPMWRTLHHTKLWCTPLSSPLPLPAVASTLHTTLVDGSITTAPRPASPHATAESPLVTYALPKFCLIASDIQCGQSV